MKLGSYLLIAAIVMGEAQELKLETWMRDLPEQLKDMPFIYLAIPGSHDSMTYGITRSSGLAPDAEPILHRLYPLFRGTIIRWTITQSLDTWQQLLIGIRYLDLRLATKPGTEDFFFTHGLYAEEISGALKQVKDFVDSHPEEVVILDLQHFYGFTSADHQRLMRLLLNTYGPKLVPRHLDLRSVTINSLNRLRQQVIVVYRNESVYTTSEFWQPQMLPSPWPQQERASGLLRFLENIRRHPGTGFVHQAVLTPTPTFIVLRYDRIKPELMTDFLGRSLLRIATTAANHFSQHQIISWTSNLRSKCAAPVVKEVLPVLSELSPGPPGRSGRTPLNVVIADFVDMADAVFPKTIIKLNMKLLQNREVVYG